MKQLIVLHLDIWLRPNGLPINKADIWPSVKTSYILAAGLIKYSSEKLSIPYWLSMGRPLPEPILIRHLGQIPSKYP